MHTVEIQTDILVQGFFLARPASCNLAIACRVVQGSPAGGNPFCPTETGRVLHS